MEAIYRKHEADVLLYFERISKWASAGFETAETPSLIYVSFQALDPNFISAVSSAVPFSTHILLMASMHFIQLKQNEGNNVEAESPG